MFISFFAVSGCQSKEEIYKDQLNLVDKGEYVKATEYFDSENKMDLLIKKGFELIDNKKTNEAVLLFYQIKDKNSIYQPLWIYAMAVDSLKDNDYIKTLYYANNIGDYSDYGADRINADKKKLIIEYTPKAKAQEEKEETERNLAILKAKEEELKRKEEERLQAIENKKLLETEKARKKSEGVRIGMTKQDVLDSSWGRPNHINTTTTAFGTREQWVYDGYNYLYFKDGILTTIQN